jgi:hypothetical protein
MAFILNLVNKKGLPVWKLAYSFSVYIILPENTHQYLFTTADNSPWNIFFNFRTHLAEVSGKKFGNFLAQNLILPGTLAFYRIVNISNDLQMLLIITRP